MTEFDIDPRNDLPTPAHRWEEQFKVAGRRSGPPPTEKIKARAELLKKFIAEFPDCKAAGAWKRELVWRRKQLENQGIKEDSDGERTDDVRGD